jgi:Carboxypeptidase regulatory-like domain
MNNIRRFSLRSILCAVAATACAAGLAVAQTRAGSVEGDVRDLAPPNDPIEGARVRLLDKEGNQVGSEVATKANGRYEIPDVGMGKYKVEVVRLGYIPRPHDYTPVTVNGREVAPEIWLMQDAGASAYYGAIASSFVKSIEGLPESQQEEGFSKFWEALRLINLPPSSKAKLAVELVKKYTPTGETASEFAAYVHAKPEDVVKAESAFREAVAGATGVPDKTSLGDWGVRVEIVPDVALHQLNMAGESKDNRDSFVKEFGLKWGGTKAPKTLTNLLDKDRKARKNPLFPSVPMGGR